MGLSLPCGKARKRANEGWPLPVRCGNRRACVTGELGPVCLAAKAARAGDVIAAKGSWEEGGVLAGRAGWACYRYAAREKRISLISMSDQRLCLWKSQAYSLTFKNRLAILARPTQLVFTTLWKGVDKASCAGPETLVAYGAIDLCWESPQIGRLIRLQSME